MEGLILDENDDAYAYDYGSFPYDFTILDVKDNIIRLKDNNAERTGSGDGIWEFPYQIDKQGRFILEQQGDIVIIIYININIQIDRTE